MSEAVDTALSRLLAALADGRMAALCHDHSVAVLVGFGSAVTSVAPLGAPRDVDVAVGFRRPPADHGVAFIMAIGDVAGTGVVDVALLDGADVVLIEEALATGELWFEDREGEAAERHIRAALVRMDTDWLRRLDLRLMAGR